MSKSWDGTCIKSVAGLNRVLYFMNVKISTLREKKRFLANGTTTEKVNIFVGYLCLVYIIFIKNKFSNYTNAK